MNWLIQLFALQLMGLMASSVEEYRFAQAEKVRFFKDLNDYKKALDEYNRKRIQNSTAPAG